MTREKGVFTAEGSSTSMRGWMSPWPETTTRFLSNTGAFIGWSIAPMSSRAEPGRSRVSASSVRMYFVPRRSAASPARMFSPPASPRSSRASESRAPRLRSKPAQTPSRSRSVLRRQKRKKPPPYLSLSSSTARAAASQASESPGRLRSFASGRSASRPNMRFLPQSREARANSSMRRASSAPESGPESSEDTTQMHLPSAGTPSSSSSRGMSRGGRACSSTKSQTAFAISHTAGSARTKSGRLLK